MLNVSTKANSTWISRSISKKITKISIFDVYVKFVLKWQNIDCDQHPRMSSQHNKCVTTSHFDMFLHILIIYKLHGSCVYA